MSELPNVVIRVRVVPRSSRNQILGLDNGIFKVKLTAPPVEGKANSALVKFLAKGLGIPKTDIEIVAGERSKTKSILVRGLTLDEINERLNP